MQGNTGDKKTEVIASKLPSIDWLNWTILQQDADELMYYMHGGELRDAWEEWMEGFEEELRTAKAADASLRRLLACRQKKLTAIFRDIEDMVEELKTAASLSTDLEPLITGIRSEIAYGLKMVGAMKDCDGIHGASNGASHELTDDASQRSTDGASCGSTGTVSHGSTGNEQGTNKEVKQ